MSEIFEDKQKKTFCLLENKHFNVHHVYVSVPPQIQASGITLALLGDRVELKCTVKAKPAPKVMFWRDHEGRVPVIVGKNYEVTIEASSTVSYH